MVNPSTPPPIEITEADEAILGHVQRFHMTTPEVVERLFFRDRGPAAAKGALRRLREGGYLRSSTLFQKRRYYHLTGRAARVLFGDREKTVKAFGEQALPRAYGVLAFCCLHEPPRHKFTAAEFTGEFPELSASRLPSGWYYRDVDGDKFRLGYIVVDHGTHFRRMVSKCHAILARRMQFPAWRALITNDQFVIAIVTARKQKADRIHQMLMEKQQTVKYRLELVPELVNLVD